MRIKRIKPNIIWEKPLENMQNNYAVIEDCQPVKIWFWGGACFSFDYPPQIFDRIVVDNIESAEHALQRNGFFKMTAEEQASMGLSYPQIKEICIDKRYYRPIYSSGEYWT